MRKIWVKLLIATAVGSVCIVGSAFGSSISQPGDHSRIHANHARIHAIYKKAFLCNLMGNGQEYIIKGDKNFTPNKPSSSFLTMGNDHQNDLTLYNGSGHHGYKNINDHNSSGTPPVPEPATMLLVGTGLVGLVGVARRNARKK